MDKTRMIGYLLLGFSGGVFTASMLYDRELRRPIGKIEQYGNVLEDAKKKENDPDETSGDVQNQIDDIDEEHEEPRIKYSGMYMSSDGKIEGILNPSYQSFINHKDKIVHHPETNYTGGDTDGDYDSYNPEDIPSDDEPAEISKSEEDYILERVEDGMEIYLEENPQDFITLVFYAGDETLCDDREQLISNPEEVVGEVALERLVSGGAGAENGLVYVRNLKTMINYEVVLDEGKYSETVLGLFESRLDKGDGGDVSNR